MVFPLMARSAALRARSEQLRQRGNDLRQQSRFILRRCEVRVLRAQDLLTISFFQRHSPPGRRLGQAAEPDTTQFRLRLMS